MHARFLNHPSPHLPKYRIGFFSIAFLNEVLIKSLNEEKYPPSTNFCPFSFIFTEIETLIVAVEILY